MMINTSEEIEAFIKHIPFDKNNVSELMPRYGITIRSLGKNILRNQTTVWCTGVEMDEFLDFIDGNGFIVDREADPGDALPVRIDII